MATFVNDLRLTELATGEGSGTWGTTTNTNLELIGEAFSFGTEAITTNADTHTTTIADGSTDPGRSLFLKYTGTLDSACTITIAPNTVSKLWFIENATSGSQNIIIKQGSGATITIPNGQTKAIYSDGAGSGGAMVDAFQDLSIPDLFVDDDLTIGDDLTFTSDSAVITFGADGDTTLTHTDGSGLTLNSTNKIMFNDASQFIQGSSATVLSLGATDEIDLTATAIDVNGTIDVSGNATLGGTLGVTGAVTANAGVSIDNFTIDGAEIDCSADMTIDVAGDLTLDVSGGDVRIKADGTQEMQFKITDGANVDIISTVADDDIRLRGNDGGSTITALTLDMSAAGAATFNDSVTIPTIAYVGTSIVHQGDSNTSLDFGTDTQTFFAGGTQTLDLASGSVVINEASADVDFRVESNGNTHMLFVDAGNDLVGIGQSSPSSYNASFDDLVVGASGATGITVVSGTSNAGTLAFADGTSGDAAYRGFVQYDHNTDGLALGSAGATALTIDSSNNVGIGTSSIDELLHVEKSSGTVLVKTEVAANSVVGFEIHKSTGSPSRWRIADGQVANGSLDIFDVTNSRSILHADSSEVAINDTSADLDFRIESNGNTHMLFVDAGAECVNIGGSTDQGGTLNIEGADSDMLVLHRTADTGDQSILFKDHGDHNATITGKNGGGLELRTNGNSTTALALSSAGAATFGGAISGTTASFATSSTSDPVFTLTDTGVAAYEVIFPDTGTYQLQTNTSSDKTFKLFNQGSGSFLLNVEGSVTGTSLIATEGLLELDDDGTHNGIINVPASCRINIDSDNNSTGESFQVGVNATNISSSNILFKIDESGNTTVGDPTYGNSLGQLRVINDANATAPASLSLFGFGNVADGGEFAKIEFAMQISGTGGNVVAKIEGEAEGTSENAADLVFHTATSASLNERMRISSVGVITKRLAASGTGMPGTSVTLADTNSVNGLSGSSNAAGLMLLSRDSGNLRSISAAGTINASGADYAEYMTKADGCGTIAKGDVVGVDVNGKLTDVFADAISFVIKSTDPSYVGGDNWMTPEQIDPDSSEYINPLSDEYNALRASQDRIAFSGQVPVNITGSFNVGDYVYPEADGSGIKAVAKSSPTFEEYQLCVGKIWATEEDGRPFVAVKIG